VSRSDGDARACDDDAREDDEDGVASPRDRVWRRARARARRGGRRETTRERWERL